MIRRPVPRPARQVRSTGRNGTAHPRSSRARRRRGALGASAATPARRARAIRRAVHPRRRARAGAQLRAQGACSLSAERLRIPRLRPDRARRGHRRLRSQCRRVSHQAGSASRRHRHARRARDHRRRGELLHASALLQARCDPELLRHRPDGGLRPRGARLAQPFRLFRIGAAVRPLRLPHRMHRAGRQRAGLDPADAGRTHAAARALPGGAGCGRRLPQLRRPAGAAIDSCFAAGRGGARSLDLRHARPGARVRTTWR